MDNFVVTQIKIKVGIKYEILDIGTDLESIDHFNLIVHVKSKQNVELSLESLALEVEKSK